MANQIIESVEVIHTHPEGPDMYRIGRKINGRMIADIINTPGTTTFLLFDEDDQPIMSIHDCPVVVRYRCESEEPQ